MRTRILLATVLAAGLLAAPFVAFASAAPGPTTLVYLRTDDPALAAAVLARPDVTPRFDLTDGWFSTALPAALANRLAASESFQVETVSTFRILAPPWCDDNPDHPACGNGDDDTSDRPTPDDPTPWGIEATYNNATVASTSGGLGIDVAVLDTGVTRDHLDLANRVEQCKDFTGGSVKENSCDDGHGHGTHVAGTVLADGGSDGLGIFGVAPEADLYAYKVCNNGGLCFGDAIAAAITRAADEGAEIISMSLGGSSLSTAEQDAIDYAVDEQGVLVIAAAGNSGPDLDTIAYPAAYWKVAAVAALELLATDPATYDASNLGVADFSSRGQDRAWSSSLSDNERLVEVAAPGVSVESTWKDGGYRYLSGTSMATPHVSGFMAKMWGSITEDLDGDGDVDGRDKRLWLDQRADDLDITLGQHASTGYDPAAGLGFPQVPTS